MFAFNPRRLVGPVPTAALQDIIISVPLWDFILSSPRAAESVSEKISVH